MRRGTRCDRLAFVAIILTLASSAAADGTRDPNELPNAPRPPTLPELTHPEVEMTSESTLGVLTRAAEAGGSRVACYVHRLGIDVPVGVRRWFVGAHYELAAGAPPQDASDIKVVSGNVELYGRAVWATPTGMAFGGGLGVIVPTSAFDNESPAAGVARGAATLRGWDNAFFQPGFVTLRPFIDVRDIEGPFVIHFRQGLDWSFEVTDSGPTRLAAFSAFYIGYRVTRQLGVGIEALEHYSLDGAMPDSKRASFYVSPNIRLMTQSFQPALSVYRSIGTAIDPAVDHVWGLRIGLTFLYEHARHTIETRPRL